MKVKWGKKSLITYIELPKDKPFADYTTEEMVAYLLTKFPNGAQEKLLELYSKRLIGNVLYQQVSLVLEGLNVKM